jgi:dTDP-glucose 4,6-dehydratase
MRQLLVTGGAGFIGSNFVHYWLTNHAHDRVVVLDALTYAGNLENLSGLKSLANYQFVHGDVCDAELTERIFLENDIDTVVHFAAESHVDRSILGPEAFIRTNVHGTFTLLETARKVWVNTRRERRFLHVSTDEVFGSLEHHELPFTETSPYQPNSPYAASKAASDHLARAYFHTYGLPVLTTNCSNNYGPYQFPEKLIPLTIINALEGQPIPVYGDGRNVRDWLHVEDHCRGIDAVLDAGTSGQTYNIGGSNERENLDIVHQICDCLDRLLPAECPRRDLITFVTDRPGHDRRYAIDASKMRNELKWQPRYAFTDGLEQTVRWYLEHRRWWERVRRGDYRHYYAQQYGFSAA